MNGELKIIIDGDLFKAKVHLPLKVKCKQKMTGKPVIFLM